MRLRAPLTCMTLLAAFLGSRATARAEGQPSFHLRSAPAQYSPPSCIIAGPYDDVGLAHPFCPYIRDLKLDGITGGCGGGKFCPDNPVTRGELAMFLERVMRGASSWDAWTDGPTSPGGLDWGAKTASGSIGTMMEYSQSPGLESGIYFDDEAILAWAPGGGGTGLFRLFDRSDGTADEILRVSSNALSFRPAGQSGAGTDANFSLEFFDDGVAGNESLGWANGQDRFEFTNDLAFTEDGTLVLSQEAAGVDMRLQTNANAAIMLDADDTTIVPIDTVSVYRDGAYDNAHKLADISETGDLRVAGAVSSNVTFDLAEAFWMSEPLAPGDLVRPDPQRPGAVLKAVAGEALLGIVSAAPGMVLGGAALNLASLEAWGDDAKARFAAERGELLAGAWRADSELRRQQDLAERHERSLAARGSDAARAASELQQDRTLIAARLEAGALVEFFRRHVAPVALAGRVPAKVDASRGAIRVGDPLTAGPEPGVAMLATHPGPVVGIALEALASGQGNVMVFVSRGWWGGERRIAGSHPAGADSDRTIAEEPAAGRRAAPVELGRDVGTLRVRGEGHAELLAVSESVEAGDVLVMDEAGAFRPSDHAEDATVVGVVAARPGVLAGPLAELGGGAAVVVAGVASMKVDASYGPIRRGDLLVTSPTRGRAMRADEPPAGTVVAKALESLADGEGEIRVLVTLR